LTLAPFQDESEAIGFIPRVYAGLMWTLLHNGLSPEATLEPQSIHYSSDPQGVASHLSKSFDIKADRVDAILEGSCPAIYQSNKEIRIITGGNVSLTLGFDSARSLDLICEAMVFPKSDSVVVDGKLQIALELYSSFFREASANARYLTLAMALEALAPEEMKPQSVIELIEDWKKEVQSRKAALEIESEEWAAYDALEREIDFRQQRSIRKRIRSLVNSVLHRHGDIDAIEVAKKAVLLYDKRGRLVHDGYLPGKELGDSTTQLREIVRRVLEARFIELTSG
jgi:hypothetical protein